MFARLRKFSIAVVARMAGFAAVAAWLAVPSWSDAAWYGSIRLDGDGVAIAGRVDSPSGYGCAACHGKPGGQDLEVLTRK